MSHWNHRVVRKVYEHAHMEPDVIYGLHEVYYDDKGNPIMCTESPVGIHEESVEELKETLERLSSALDTPVLNYEDIQCAEDYFGDIDEDEVGEPW